MTFNNVKLTQESILAVRQHYINLAERCIAAAEAGEWYVNDVPAYAKSQRLMASDFEAGLFDHNLSVRQRAYYLQTDEEVALLP